jgi:hypothetical protein
VKGARLPRRPARQQALDAAHQGVEWGSGIALAEVNRREPTQEAVDAETAVAGGVDVAAHHEASASDHLAVLFYSVHRGPERSTSAAREDAEVVCILKVLIEHDVANVEKRGQLRDREVPHTPGVLEPGKRSAAGVAAFTIPFQGLEVEETQIPILPSRHPATVQIFN